MLSPESLLQVADDLAAVLQSFLCIDTADFIPFLAVGRSHSMRPLQFFTATDSYSGPKKVCSGIWSMHFVAQTNLDNKEFLPIDRAGESLSAALKILQLNLSGHRCVIKTSLHVMLISTDSLFCRAQPGPDGRGAD